MGCGEILKLESVLNKSLSIKSKIDRDLLISSPMNRSFNIESKIVRLLPLISLVESEEI